MTEWRDAASFGRAVASYGPRIRMGRPIAIEQGTRHLASIVSRHGRRYTIRARNGRQVPLGSKTLIRSGYAGVVKADPAGFWTIVQEGSAPHEIMSRRAARLAAGRSRRSTQRRLAIAFGGAGGYVGTRPIRTPAGPRFRVRHPGHGRIGDPWGRAKDEGAREVPPVLARALLSRIRP